MNTEQIKAHYQYFKCIKTILTLHEELGFKNRVASLDAVRTQLSIYKIMLDIVRELNRHTHKKKYKVGGECIDFLDYVIHGDKELSVMYTLKNDTLVLTCVVEKMEIVDE